MLLWLVSLPIHCLAHSDSVIGEHRVDCFAVHLRGLFGGCDLLGRIDGPRPRKLYFT